MPPPPPTPNPHQTLRARAATAAQLAASAVGPTAGAARQPRSSPRKAGVQPGLHVWAYDVPRAACASSGALALARRGRGHIREHLHGTQAGTPTRRLPAGVPPALRPGRSQRWLNAVPAASQRRRRACYASTFPDSKSQFSFLVSQRPGVRVISLFLCADYQMKREFTRTIPDSYFSLRAPASVHWAL